jgi:hypothetical protein
VFAPVPGTREVVPGARASVEPDAEVRVTGVPRWGSSSMVYSTVAAGVSEMPRCWASPAASMA